MSKKKKFPFSLNEMVEQNINEKREVIYTSLCKYLSIPDEQKQDIIQEAKTVVPPCTFSQRVKKKRRRL